MWDGPPRDGAPLTAPLDGISNHHPQQKPARRHDRLRVIVGGSKPGCRCARLPWATRGGGGGAGAGVVRAQWPLWQDSPSQPGNFIRFQRHRDPSNTSTPSDPWGHECRLPPL